MKKLMIIALLIGTVLYSCSKDEGQPTSAPANNETAINESFSSGTRTLTITNNTICDYKYDVFICPDSTCCLDTLSLCVYDTTAYVDSMNIDTSLSFSTNYTICKIIVTEINSGASCTVGKPVCGYNRTCTNPNGCNGDPFTVKPSGSGGIRID